MPKGIKGFQKGNTEGRKCKGEKNSSWLGDKVGYAGIHLWINKYKKKPRFCQTCHKKTSYLDLANMVKEYKRKIENFKYICRSCHMKKDGRLVKLLSHRAYKRVGQYALNNKLIKIWKSIRHASNALNISHSSISHCCIDNNRKTCGGFIWELYGEDK